MAKPELLSYEEQNKIIDQALREHYRETWAVKRVPSDYLVMFTEGGESNAVADAIAKAQLKKDKARFT
jgi:phosphoserine aminotransferase